MKCTCGDTNCKQEIRFDNASHALWFTDKNGDQNLMYLDANATIELIRELRDFLNYMATESA